jgi:hypothetical protein
MKQSKSTGPLSVLLVASALALLPPMASGAPAELGAGSGVSDAGLSSGGHSGRSAKLKYLSTTVTTVEIWIPFLGWTVVCETTSVKCGKGGNDCPWEPQA